MSLPEPDGPGVRSRARGQLVYESATTRVFRIPAAAGSSGAIYKEPLGANAVQRLRHERDILAFLTKVEGIGHPGAGPHPSGMLALQDAGEPLAQTGRGARPALPALLAFSRQMAQILAAVHQAGVIHGDISPHNIILTHPYGGPTLIDFDLANSAALARPRFLDTSRMARQLRPGASATKDSTRRLMLPPCRGLTPRARPIT